jgi:hypothetical protein
MERSSGCHLEFTAQRPGSGTGDSGALSGGRQGREGVLGGQAVEGLGRLACEAFLSRTVAHVVVASTRTATIQGGTVRARPCRRWVIRKTPNFAVMKTIVAMRRCSTRPRGFRPGAAHFASPIATKPGIRVSALSGRARQRTRDAQEQPPNRRQVSSATAGTRSTKFAMASTRRIETERIPAARWRPPWSCDPGVGGGEPASPDPLVLASGLQVSTRAHHLAESRRQDPSSRGSSAVRLSLSPAASGAGKPEGLPSRRGEAAFPARAPELPAPSSPALPFRRRARASPH